MSKERAFGHVIESRRAAGSKFAERVAPAGAGHTVERGWALLEQALRRAA